MNFSEESLSKSGRVGFHDFFLCVSNVEDSDGNLISEFTKSQLWIRRSLTDVPALGTKDYVVPIEGTLSVADGSLSKAQRMKQWTSGPKVYEKLIDKLWQGLNDGKHCVYVDVLGYDGSLGMAVLQQRIQPVKTREASLVLNLIWAMDDSGADHRSKTAKWIQDSFLRQVRRLTHVDKIKVPGLEFQLAEWSEQSQSPQFDLAKFTLCMPLTSTGMLPLRSSVLDEYTFTRFADGFTKMVEDHNRQYNPSGINFSPKQGSDHPRGVKRKACNEAESLKGLEYSEELEQPTVELDRNPKYDLIIAADKNVYLRGKTDCQVGTDQPLMLAWGEYRTEGEVEKRQKAHAKLMMWQMASMDYEAYFFADEVLDLKPDFSPAVSPLSAFTGWLEEKSIVNTPIQCHKLEGDGVAPTQPCAFELKTLPAKQQVTWQSLSCISVNWHDHDDSLWLHVFC